MANSASKTKSRRQGGSLRVLIVDDHSVLRTGTRQVLDTSDDIVVVGEADSGNAALALMEQTDPNVVLIDVRLPDRNGIDVSRELSVKHPDVRVVVLSAYDDERLVRFAFDVGVTGYLLKTISREKLLSAVRAAGQGTRVLDPDLPPRLADSHRSTSPVGWGPLTWREAETVRLVAEGLTNKVIATRLGVSSRTVEGHLNHAFAKLGVESRTELVRLVLTSEPLPDDQSSEFGPWAVDGLAT